MRADPLEAGAWLKTSSNTVALALNLVPFAGIPNMETLQKLPFYGSSACCATVWESLKTASLPPSFSAAGFYSSRWSQAGAISPGLTHGDDVRVTTTFIAQSENIIFAYLSEEWTNASLL